MARPKYDAHPDANQPQIVRDLEAVKFLVINVSRWLPIPDLFVFGWHVDTGFGYWTAWEIKTTEGKLTAFQWLFMKKWPGAVQEARMTEDILRAYGRAR